MKLLPLDPAKDGHCHPAQAKRTKCACGKTCRLPTQATRCECGRVHRKDKSVSAFANTRLQSLRPGGKQGCPGCPVIAEAAEQQEGK